MPPQTPTSPSSSPPSPTPASPTEPAKPKTAIKNPPIIWKETQEILAAIETKLGGKVVSYYVSSGWRMVQDDVKYFYSHLKHIGHQKKLYFILISPGGDGMSAWRTASLLRNFCDELVIVLPEMAASAATMLSLAGDELIMTPLAYLTAVDTSLFHPLNPRNSKNEPVSVELDEVRRSIKFLTENSKDGADPSEIYKTIFTYIHPVALGAVERSTNLSEMLCLDIMELRKVNPLPPEAKSRIINKLNTGYPAHGYPIPRHKARELGLTVNDSDNELDNLLWSLINTYRYLTEPVRTELSESFIHTETVTKVIESLTSRLIVHNILERKLDPIIKGWSTFKDEFKWIALSEKEENGKKSVKLSYLDF